MTNTDILNTIKQKQDQIKLLQDQIEQERQNLQVAIPDWNKKQDLENKTSKLKNNCIAKIKNDLKINNELSISDIVETFFNAIIKNIDNEDYVKEIMIAKNKLKIITDKII